MAHASAAIVDREDFLQLFEELAYLLVVVLITEGRPFDVWLYTY